jgi:membrane protease YdiL (CAAX protease family)
MTLLYLLMMAGPSVAGILMTGLLYGRAGLSELFSRLFRWRVGFRWYGLALLTTPLLATATLLGLAQVSSDFVPRILSTEDKAFLVQFGLVSGLMVGVAEELGWTGFATPTLRRRYGVAATGLIVGLVIGVWQMLLVNWTSFGAAGDLPRVLYLPAVTLTWLPSYRVLMVWVYEHTESLFVAIVMHASLIAFWYILTPLTIAGATMVTYYLLFSVGMWVVIAAAALANGGQLGRRPLRRQTA